MAFGLGENIGKQKKLRVLSVRNPQIATVLGYRV